MDTTAFPAGYDRQWVLEQIGGDEGLLREIAAVFIADSSALRQRLQHELQQGSHDSLHAAAHCAKSAVSNFGVRPAIEAALTLEAAAKKGEPHARLNELTAALCTQLQQVEGSLQNELR
jgi:HPt (histidine-containing phosphotransfer) domain-containing protein